MVAWVVLGSHALSESFGAIAWRAVDNEVHVRIIADLNVARTDKCWWFVVWPQDFYR